MVDVLLMPYNYLLDPHIRKLMEIDLEKAVIIMDEAHNVENFAE